MGAVVYVIKMFSTTDIYIIHDKVTSCVFWSVTTLQLLSFCRKGTRHHLGAVICHYHYPTGPSEHPQIENYLNIYLLLRRYMCNLLLLYTYMYVVVMPLPIFFVFFVLLCAVASRGLGKDTPYNLYVINNLCIYKT